jgi:uncharacterized membrane protein YhiD involved in acid resistance
VRNRNLRFAVEAAAIVGVAAGVGLAHLGRNATIAAVAVVWLVVGAVEYRLARRPR